MRGPHASQRLMRSEAKRFNVVDCGRRWGKTSEGINLAAERALRGMPVAWCSPTYRMMAEVWREFVNLLEPVTVRKSVAEYRLEVLSDPAGGLIDLWSLDDPNTIRGRAYARAIVDEAARVPNLLDAWNRAVRPTLTDYRGDAWFLSTPKGLNGFWTLYQRGQDPLEPDWASWQFKTETNPFIDPAEIAAAREGLPEQDFAQEYEAEFISDGNGIFRNLTAATTSQPLTQGEPGHGYVYGVDWGKLHDFTVISVLDAVTRRQVAIDRFNQIDYRFQLQRLRAMVERFPTRGIVAERNAMGEPLIEHLQAMRLPVFGFKTTQQSKKLAIEALSLGFERGTLKILPDRVQLGELQAYEGRRSLAGMLSYGAPEGGHDDTVMALALAYLGTLNQRAEVKALDWHYVG